MDDGIRLLDATGAPPPAPPPRRRSRLPVIVAIAVTASAVVFAPAIGLRPEPTRDPPSSPTTTRALSEVRPDHNPDPAVVGPPPARTSVLGTSITVVTDEAVWRFDPPYFEPGRQETPSGSTAQLDATGSHIAWIADSGDFSTVLHVERLDDPAPTIVYAGASPVWSARWHASRLGRIAATGRAGAGNAVLVTASVVLDGFPKQHVIDLDQLASRPGGYWNVVAWGDFGFVLVHQPSLGRNAAEVVTLDADGGLVARASGIGVLAVSPTGTVALREGRFGDIIFTDLSLSTRVEGATVPDRIDRLAWLPGEASIVTKADGTVSLLPKEGGSTTLLSWPIGWSTDGTMAVIATQEPGATWSATVVDGAGRVVARFALDDRPLQARFRPIVTGALALGD